MSYFCPNCGGWRAASNWDSSEFQGRTSKKQRLDVYKCSVCEKTYLIHVLKK